MVGGKDPGAVERGEWMRLVEGKISERIEQCPLRIKQLAYLNARIAQSEKRVAL
jgi:hypothetical protein